MDCKCFRDVGSYLKLDEQVVMWRHNLPPQVEIGLTDLLKPGWVITHPAHPSTTSLPGNTLDCKIIHIWLETMEIIKFESHHLILIFMGMKKYVAIYFFFCHIKSNFSSKPEIYYYIKLLNVHRILIPLN